MLISIPIAVAQATTSADTIAVVADVASIVIAAAVLVLAVLAAWFFVRLNRMLGDLRTATQEKLGPVSDRAKIISDNLEFITQALRTDVEQLNASVRALTDRLHDASERMEDRIADFNALMEVVQDEAEDIFIDSASTVRGVREGARAIASPGASDMEPTAPEEEDAPTANGG